jgi:hypothetical protein
VESHAGACATIRFWPPAILGQEKTEAAYRETAPVRKYGEALLQCVPRLEEMLALPGAWLSGAAQLAEIGDVRPNHLVIRQDDPRYALNNLLRVAAHRKPLLLIVEYLDWAERIDPLWLDYLRQLGEDIAHPEDRLPVLVLATLESAKPIEQLSGDQHTESTRLVQDLVRRGLAEAHHLGRISVQDVTAALCPGAPELGERLYELSDGHPLTTESLWEEWLLNRAVEPDAEGHWRTSADAPDRWWVYGETRDHARVLLERALARQATVKEVLEAGHEAGIAWSVTEAQRVLNCAAVEAAADASGVFSTEVVADVLGYDADDLIDFLDEFLVAEHDDGCEGEGSESEPGIVAWVGFDQISSYARLSQYRFGRPYVLHVWAKYPELRQERREWSAALADSLERRYYPLQHLIGPKIEALFKGGGQPERAEAYRHQLVVRASIATQIYHVQLLMAGTEDSDLFGTYRLFNYGFSACERLGSHPQWWQHGLRIARELKRLSVLQPSKIESGSSWLNPTRRRFSCRAVNLDRRCCASVRPCSCTVSQHPMLEPRPRVRTKFWASC